MTNLWQFDSVLATNNHEKCLNFIANTSRFWTAFTFLFFLLKRQINVLQICHMMLFFWCHQIIITMITIGFQEFIFLRESKTVQIAFQWVERNNQLRLGVNGKRNWNWSHGIFKATWFLKNAWSLKKKNLDRKVDFDLTPLFMASCSLGESEKLREHSQFRSASAESPVSAQFFITLRSFKEIFSVR